MGGESGEGELAPPANPVSATLRLKNRCVEVNFSICSSGVTFNQQKFNFINFLHKPLKANFINDE